MTEGCDDALSRTVRLSTSWPSRGRPWPQVNSRRKKARAVRAIEMIRTWSGARFRIARRHAASLLMIFILIRIIDATARSSVGMLTRYRVVGLHVGHILINRGSVVRLQRIPGSSLSGSWPVSLSAVRVTFCWDLLPGAFSSISMVTLRSHARGNPCLNVREPHRAQVPGIGRMAKTNNPAQWPGSQESKPTLTSCGHSAFL